MSEKAPCKYGCGADVETFNQICPSCGGQQPYPDDQQAGSAGRFEKGCFIVLIVGGLLAGIALLATKLIVGW